MPIRTKMTIPPVMQDVADILAFRDTQPGPGAVGTHGYCMSGPYSLPPRATQTALPPPAAYRKFKHLFLLTGTYIAEPARSQSQEC
jgi:hypothetical protein